MKDKPKKTKVNLREKSFEEIIQILYNNQKQLVTMGVLLVVLNKFEQRLIKKYGIKEKPSE